MAKGTGIGLWQAAARSVDLVAGKAAATRPFVIDVTGGAHTGARAEFAKPSCSIGSSIQSDIVLRDAGIEPIHARMRRRGGSIEIDAVGGDVGLFGGDIISRGHGRLCRLPLEAAFGDARIRLTQAGTAHRRGGFANRTLLAAGMLLFLVAGLSFAANRLSLAGTGEHGAARKLTQLAFADGSQNVMTDATQVGGVGASLTEAREQLQAHLRQASLALDVEKDNGRLVVSGTIPEGRSDAWTATQAWFDETYGGRFLLASSVATGAAVAAPRLKLRAIWYGERPYVIAADGARYHEGAFTGDGWVVKHIGEQELLLTKDGASVALKYR
jgi:hypothetical protein